MIRSNIAVLDFSVSGLRDIALGFLDPSAPATDTKRSMKQHSPNIRAQIMNARNDTVLIYRDIFRAIDEFTAQRFTAICARPAAKRMRILPVTQHD
jgi:hypothetical protein